MSTLLLHIKNGPMDQIDGPSDYFETSNIDGLVRSSLGRRCEERSDEAISIFHCISNGEIASLRSQ
jgi:hypothetical protein